MTSELDGVHGKKLPDRHRLFLTRTKNSVAAITSGVTAELPIRTDLGLLAGRCQLGRYCLKAPGARRKLA